MTSESRRKTTKQHHLFLSLILSLSLNISSDRLWKYEELAGTQTSWKFHTEIKLQTSKMYLDLLTCLNRLKCPFCHLVSRPQSVLQKNHYWSLSKSGIHVCTNKIISLCNIAWILPSLQGLHRDWGSGSSSKWLESLFAFWNPGWNEWWNPYWRGYYVIVLPQKSRQTLILWAVEKSVEKMQVGSHSHIVHWLAQFSLKDQDLIVCVSYVNNISPSVL